MHFTSFLEEGRLTAGHARLLAGLPEADAIRWGNEVVMRGLNVRELENGCEATPEDIDYDDLPF